MLSTNGVAPAPVCSTSRACRLYVPAACTQKLGAEHTIQSPERMHSGVRLCVAGAGSHAASCRHARIQSCCGLTDEQVEQQLEAQQHPCEYVVGEQLPVQQQRGARSP